MATVLGTAKRGREIGMTPPGDLFVWVKCYSQESGRGCQELRWALKRGRFDSGLNRLCPICVKKSFQVQSAGLADGHPKMTTIELVLFLTFRLPPRKVGRTGDLRGDATLDIRFQGPPPVYEVKFRVMGRLTKNARSYYPHCVTYTAKPIHEKLLALTRKELTAIGDKIATVIKAEVGCNCKPITADQFDPNVSDLW